MLKFLILLLLISPLAFAEDVATYSGATVTGCQNIGNTNIFLTNPNDYSTVRAGYIYMASGCRSLTVPFKYLKQSNGEIVEMTALEKSAVDSAEAQEVIDAETARLSALDDEMVKSQSIRVTKAEQAIDNITNLADAKIFLKRLVRYLAEQR